jgi:FkbM family methyltransferase
MWQRTVSRVRGTKIHNREIILHDVELGSEYGGWSVDLSYLDAQSVIYSVGVGEDISFDLRLISAVGCDVYAFDPTPIAVEWMRRQDLPLELKFFEIGLAAQDNEIAFQIPPIEGRHSYSRDAETNAKERGTVKCKVHKLSSIMSKLRHTAIDLIKMDIEGFEYEVLNNIMEEGIRPRFILVEFHHTHYGIKRKQTATMVARLREYEYKIYWVSDVGFEYGFVDSRRA